MPGFFLRTVIVALGLWLAARLVTGITIETPLTLVLAALLLGVVNAIVRPVFVVLTFPITLITLGLFLFVVNAAMLGLVAALLPGMSIAGLGSAILGSIVISITSWLASRFIGPRGRFEVIVVERRVGRGDRFD